MADFDGAKVALFVGDQVLIILRDDRPDIPFPNMWDFPGGGREGDETPYETMARETLEEVNLVVPRETVIWRKSYAAPSGDPLLRWFFVARLGWEAAGAIVLGDEGQAWRLVTPAEYLSMPDTVPALRSRFEDWMQTVN